MPTRRATLRGIVTVAVLGLGGCSSNGSDGTGTPEGPDAPTLGMDLGDGDLAISSSAFGDGETIPAEYTGDGADRSPPLSVGGVTAEAESLALIVDDPDAPSGTFVHWLLWNLPPDTTELPAGQPQTETLDELGGARQGTNGFGELGYRGPKPPESDGPHAYRFRLRALDTTLDVEAGAERDALTAAMGGHVLASAQLTGEYER